VRVQEVLLNLHTKIAQAPLQCNARTLPFQTFFIICLTCKKYFLPRTLQGIEYALKRVRHLRRGLLDNGLLTFFTPSDWSVDVRKKGKEKRLAISDRGGYKWNGNFMGCTDLDVMEKMQQMQVWVSFVIIDPNDYCSLHPFACQHFIWESALVCICVHHASKHHPNTLQRASCSRCGCPSPTQIWCRKFWSLGVICKI